MKIICISGKAESGKDTLANLMKEEFEKKGKGAARVIHFADLLKYVCKEHLDWDGHKDEKGRQMLQDVGTLVRDYDEGMWARFVCDMIYLFDHLERTAKVEYVLVPDTRYETELDYLVKRFEDVYHIRVERANHNNQLTDMQKHHPSECDLDYTVKSALVRNRSMDELARDAGVLCSMIAGENLQIYRKVRSELGLMGAKGWFDKRSPTLLMECEV